MSLYWAIWGMAVALALGLILGGWSERRRARSRALMEEMYRANDLSRTPSAPKTNLVPRPDRAGRRA